MSTIIHRLQFQSYRIGTARNVRGCGGASRPASRGGSFSTSPPTQGTDRRCLNDRRSSLPVAFAPVAATSPRIRCEQQRRGMAGHNKWSKIKRKKGANDAARASAHGKAALAIQAASRACGGDASNLHLQSTISAARAMQLPKERISAAIERGTNAKSGGEGLVRMRYDGIVPTGAAKISVIVLALTDNNMRTSASVRAGFKKFGGEMLPTGANDWFFENIGMALVPKKSSFTESKGDKENRGKISEEELLEISLEGNATDLDFGSSEDKHAIVKCDASDLHSLVQTLRESNVYPSEFESRWVVRDESNVMDLDEENAEAFAKFLDRMDDDIDVTDVYHNAFL